MAPLTGSHPFINGCGEVAKETVESIAEIRTWLKTQSCIPELTDEHIYMFLHSNYYDTQTTQKTIHMYFMTRASAPELFLNRSPLDPQLQAVWKMLYMVPLPKTTPEGYKVLIYKLKETDPAKFDHVMATKAMILYSDIRMSEDGICPGYVIVGDPQGFGASHLKRIRLSILTFFVKYMQEAKPVRLKGLHIIHSSKIIDALVSLSRPLMRSELIKVLQVHTENDLSSLYKYVPQEILPKEYGGEAESLDVLHDKNCQMMATKYANWIADEDKYVAECRRLQGLD